MKDGSPLPRHVLEAAEAVKPGVGVTRREFLAMASIFGAYTGVASSPAVFRIGVARGFAGRPMVVVADEPVSALDVSVRAAVTGLLNDIQRESRTTLLFISHDLAVVRYIADRVVVLYLGISSNSKL